MLLEGRSVAITGAGSGIGRALAIEFAQRGAIPILIGRNADKLAETVSLLPAAVPTKTCIADITSAQGREAIVQLCIARGQLDILINNAGLVPSGLLCDLTDTELQNAVMTNIVAPIALTRDLQRVLRRSDRPRVVNIGSIFGDIGHPYFAAYCATKFALRGFSDAIRRELAADGIGVTYAAPRATRTAAADGFQSLISPYGMSLDQPQTVARQIVLAVERESATVYAAGAERIFVAIQRLLPRLVDLALISKTRKLRSGPVSR
jgi:short-subunit dehydrogenase